jgi:anionic cell wall polymer biosynthesis LytR-Cps2A-Psr (LCP) family protein
VRGVRFGSVTIGHIGYAVTCLAAAIVLVVAGYAHKTVGELDALGNGVGISGSPSVGAMNILVMGLESRTNFQGQTLSSQQLTETHSGSVNGVENLGVGAQDTDTLILIHIFAGGHKAVGFSIPRDDVVNFPHATLDGLTEGKIDAAYDYAYNQYVDDNNGKMSNNALYLGANQAGQLFEIQTVESVTGVHIDHFAESNIIGFYYLAQQFGGMEVCIKPAPAQGGFPVGANLTDIDTLVDPPTNNSGFNAYHDGYNRKKGGAQYLHLSPAQALAYVRSRDTLPGVDIGRTARQQAAIDYVIWKLKTEGVLSDIGAITSLLSTAKDYLITDSGWDLPDFATDMSALTGKNLSFTTLASAPTNDVQVPGYPSAQSVNFIDVPQIQREVSEAFYGNTSGTATAAPPASSVTVDVYNGSGASELAGQVAQDLVAMGYEARADANSSSQSQPVADDTQVFYGAGAELNGEKIANDLGTTSAPLSSLPAGHVEVLLGSTVTAPSPGLLTYGASTVTASDYASAAHADGISVAGLPGASDGGTQSVSAAILGARSATSGATSETPTPKPSKSNTSGSGAGAGSVTVAPNARYGIPCVY